MIAVIYAPAETYTGFEFWFLAFFMMFCIFLPINTMIYMMWNLRHLKKDTDYTSVPPGPMFFRMFYVTFTATSFEAMMGINSGLSYGSSLALLYHLAGLAFTFPLFYYLSVRFMKLSEPRARRISVGMLLANIMIIYLLPSIQGYYQLILYLTIPTLICTPIIIFLYWFSLRRYAGFLRRLKEDHGKGLVF